MYKIIFSGFGGQGIQTMSKLLAYAAMDSDYKVSWLPSYGPEMRGGTSNCSVIISSDDIDSPLITKADVIVAMNNPSLNKFQPFLRKGGLLLINSSLVTVETNRKDITVVKIPCEELAINTIGNKSFANMIILGYLIKCINIVNLEELIDSIKTHGKNSYFDMNKRALIEGYNLFYDNI